MKRSSRPEEMLVRLSRLADRESAPMADISARVIRRIRSLPAQPERPLLLLALGSAAAAALVLAFALPAWKSWTDPLSQVMMLAGGGIP